MNSHQNQYLKTLFLNKDYYTAFPKKVIPTGTKGNPDIVVLSAETLTYYASILKSHMDVLRLKLDTLAIATGVSEELAEQNKENLEYRTKNPEEHEFTQRMIRVFTKSFNTVPTHENKTQYEAEFERRISSILAAPITQTGDASTYIQYASTHTNTDGLNPDPDTINIDTGIPHEYDLFKVVPRLIFDILIARELELELITNSATEKEMSNAKSLLDSIENEDLVTYLTFTPR